MQGWPFDFFSEIAKSGQPFSIWPSANVVWYFLNSNLVVGVVGAFIGLMQYRLAKQQAVENRYRLAESKAKGESLDSGQIPPTGSSEPSPPHSEVTPQAPASDVRATDAAASRDLWSKGAEAVGEMKDAIEKIVSQTRHGGTRRRYENIPRYSYSDLIDALTKDGKLNPKLSDRLKSSLDRWRSFRTGRNRGALSSDLVRELEELSREVLRIASKRT